MSKKIQTKTKTRYQKRTLDSFSVCAEEQNSQGSQGVFLYRFVYSSTFSFCASFLILISFLLQGVESAYADYEVSNDTSNTVVEIAPEDVIVDVVPAIETENTIAEEEEEIVEESQEDTDELIDEADGFNDLNATTTVVFDNSSSTLEDVIEIDSEADQSNGTTSEEEIEEQELVDEEAIEEVDEIVEEVVDEAESVEVTHEAVSITQSDSAFSFTRDECTQLATGSFYCLKSPDNALEDALFSAPDADGDLEIFFVRDGVQVQITKNKEDDSAPYYDQNTDTIVWHRLINDRYQVILYDIDTKTETILTNTSSNNMEPTKQGDYIVWQRWVDGGWNIILYDGKKENQITTTTGNNVAPYLHGSLVVWNRHDKNGNKTIEIYNMDSKTYVSVDDPDGLSVSNPRMVFVYDSLSPNGDIVTKGYDVLAKRFIELDTLPRELPKDIPTSDSTGETRALIQSKPSLKSEVEELTGATTTPSISDPEPNVVENLVVSTTTPTLTLDLSTSTLEIGDLLENPPIEESETTLAEFDLVIEKLDPQIEIDPVEQTPESVQE